MTTRPDLTDEEVDAICAGLLQNAAKVRYLQRMGLRVQRRPNGRPLVARADWDRIWQGGQRASQLTPGANAPKWRVAA